MNRLSFSYLILLCSLFAFACNGSGSTSSAEEAVEHTDETGETCETLSACGNCDLDCRNDGFGGETPKTGEPFSEGSGIVETEEGITVDVHKVETHFIWVANSGEGSVSKIDTRTYEEVGRYMSGPDGEENDPSRTSVNAYGDVFIGNRRGMSVTKISGQGQDCLDNNGDGVITTSTNANDILPWGQDDCVLWNTRLADGDIIRAVAAQDVPANNDLLVQPSVWIGGWGGVVWRLDSDTGKLMVRTTSPVRPYGFALDRAGNLWIASRENAFGRINTHRCVDEASCNVDVCGADGDDCIKQRVPIDEVPYGITVDHEQRVWLGGDAVIRYDRREPVGSRLTYVRGGNGGIWIHGIQADLDGNIWGAAPGQGVMRFDADNPNSFERVAGTEGSATKGIAVDLDGKIWSINLESNDATIIAPGPTLRDNDVVHNVSGLVWPYTYSDMTGSQLQFATDQTGFLRRTFAGCPGTVGTDWLVLRWDAEIPAGTRIRFLARAASSQAALQGLSWNVIADVPPDTSPLDLAAKLQSLGLDGKLFLQVEAQLVAVRNPDNTSASPILRSMEVNYHCGPEGGNGYGDNNGTGEPNNSINNGNGGVCIADSGACNDDSDCCSGICGRAGDVTACVAN